VVVFNQCSAVVNSQYITQKIKCNIIIFNFNKSLDIYIYIEICFQLISLLEYKTNLLFLFNMKTYFNRYRKLRKFVIKLFVFRIGNISHIF